MSLRRLLTWIKAKRRGWTRPVGDEEGVVISRRLQELLDVTRPKQVDAASTPNQKQDDKDQRSSGRFGT
jgi:hypothetical protein